MTDINPELPSRRDFLSAGTTGESAQNSGTEDTLGAIVPPESGGPLMTFSQNAMGCQFQLICAIEQQRSLANLVADGFEVVQELEQRLTVYRQTSQISRVNQFADQTPVAVDEEVFQLLRDALQISDLTDGAFDITTGPLSQLWSVHRRQGSLPNQIEIDSVLGQIGSNGIQLDPDNATVRFTRPHMEINLGGIGKGFAIDRFGDFLRSGGANHFVIHGGQSSVMANGSRTQGHQTQENRTQENRTQENRTQENRTQENRTTSSSDTSPWVVAISHPLLPRQRLVEIDLQDQAIGTSGSGRQHFVHHGKRFGHIIDPRTGWPADQVLSATVIAPTATLADALATAMVILGPDGAELICKTNPQIGAVLITESTKQGQLNIETINVDSHRFRML